jgi:nucleoside-diphosphate-sugar epimerase
MRVLVLGANGVVGGAVARRLAHRSGFDVWAAARRERPPFANASVFDLTHAPHVEEALADIAPDLVVQAAGRRHGSAEELQADNVLATATLAEALSHVAPSAGLILIGSAAQYGASPGRVPWRETDRCEPATPYGVAKQAAEQSAFAVADRLGLKVLSLRLFNVVDPAGLGGDVVSIFLRDLAKARATGTRPWSVRIGPLGAVRDFVSLDDAASAVERAAERDVWGETINVCTGVGRTARSLIAELADELGDVLIEEDVQGGATDPDWSVGDPARCSALLGFVPTADLATTLKWAARLVTHREKAADA